MAGKTKTFKELCQEYGISRQTLRNEIEKIPGLVIGSPKRIFFPAEIEKIYQHLGDPRTS
jgi:DNA-binding XRE family transcriptional regulator